MTVNDQTTSPDIRMPDIGSIVTPTDVPSLIKAVEKLTQFWRIFEHEWESVHRGNWRDIKNVYDVELPFISGGASADFDIPLVTDIVFTLSGTEGIQWTSGTIRYAGTTYSVNSGNVDPAEFVFIDVGLLAEPTTLSTGTGTPAVAGGRWWLANRESTNVYEALQSPIIHGGVIQANTVTTTEVAFTVVDESSVIGTINASTEGLNIDADNLNIAAATTFTAGWGGASNVSLSEVDSSQNTKLVGIESNADVTSGSAANNAKLDHTGGDYKSASSGSRVLIFPDSNTGIQVIDNASNDVFKVVVGGTDVGDVIIGDHSGGEGLKYDKSAGTFDLLGTSLTFDGGNLGSATDFFNITGGELVLSDVVLNRQFVASNGQAVLNYTVEDIDTVGMKWDWSLGGGSLVLQPGLVTGTSSIYFYKFDGTLTDSKIQITANSTSAFIKDFEITGCNITSTSTIEDVTSLPTVTTAKGGTGLTSAGTSGNVLTSNGSVWGSSAPSTGSKFETGTYTGDGNATQDIAVGFDPDEVTVYPEDEARSVFTKTRTMTGTDSKDHQNANYEPDAITALGTLKFTVGDGSGGAAGSDDMNTNSAEYHWSARKS